MAFSESASTSGLKRNTSVEMDVDDKRSRLVEAETADQGNIESHLSTGAEPALILKKRLNELLTEERTLAGQCVCFFVESASLRKKIAFATNHALQPEAQGISLHRDVGNLLANTLPLWQTKLNITTELLDAIGKLKERTSRLRHLVEAMYVHFSDRGRRILLFGEEGKEIWNGKVTLALEVLEEEETILEGLKVKYNSEYRRMMDFINFETINCHKLLRESAAGQAGQVTSDVVKAMYKVAVIPKASLLSFVKDVGKRTGINSKLTWDLNFAVDEILASQFQIVAASVASKELVPEWTNERHYELSNHLSRVETAWKQLKMCKELYHLATRCGELAENETNARRLFCAMIRKMKLSRPNMQEIENHFRWINNLSPTGELSHIQSIP